MKTPESEPSNQSVSTFPDGTALQGHPEGALGHCLVDFCGPSDGRLVAPGVGIVGVSYLLRQTLDVKGEEEQAALVFGRRALFRVQGLIRRRRPASACWHAVPIPTS